MEAATRRRYAATTPLPPPIAATERVEERVVDIDDMPTTRMKLERIVTFASTLPITIPADAATLPTITRIAMPVNATTASEYTLASFAPTTNTTAAAAAATTNSVCIAMSTNSITIASEYTLALLTPTTTYPFAAAARMEGGCESAYSTPVNESNENEFATSSHPPQVWINTAAVGNDLAAPLRRRTDTLQVSPMKIATAAVSLSADCCLRLNLSGIRTDDDHLLDQQSESKKKKNMTTARKCLLASSPMKTIIAAATATIIAHSMMMLEENEEHCHVLTSTHVQAEELMMRSNEQKTEKVEDVEHTAVLTSTECVENTEEERPPNSFTYNTIDIYGCDRMVQWEVAVIVVRRRSGTIGTTTMEESIVCRCVTVGNNCQPRMMTKARCSADVL